MNERMRNSDLNPRGYPAGDQCRKSWKPLLLVAILILSFVGIRHSRQVGAGTRNLAEELVGESRTTAGESEPMRLFFADMKIFTEKEEEIFGGMTVNAETGYHEHHVHVTNAEGRFFRMKYRAKPHASNKIHNLESDPNIESVECGHRSIMIKYNSADAAKNARNSVLRLEEVTGTSSLVITGRHLFECPLEIRKKKNGEREMTDAVRRVTGVTQGRDNQYLRLELERGGLLDVFADLELEGETNLVNGGRPLDAPPLEDVEYEAQEEHPTEPTKERATFTAENDGEEAHEDIFGGFVSFWNNVVEPTVDKLTPDAIKNEINSKVVSTAGNWLQELEKVWSKITDKRTYEQFVEDVGTEAFFVTKSFVYVLTEPPFTNPIAIVAVDIYEAAAYAKTPEDFFKKAGKNLANSYLEYAEYVGMFVNFLRTGIVQRTINGLHWNYNANTRKAKDVFSVAKFSSTFSRGMTKGGKVDPPAGRLSQPKRELAKGGSIALQCINCYARFGGITVRFQVSEFLTGKPQFEISAGYESEVMLELLAGATIQGEYVIPFFQIPIPKMSIPLGIATVGFELKGQATIGVKVTASQWYFKYHVVGAGAKMWAKYKVGDSKPKFDISTHGFSHERKGPVMKTATALEFYVQPSLALLFSSFLEISSSLLPTLKFSVAPRKDGCSVDFAINFNLPWLMSAQLALSLDPKYIKQRDTVTTQTDKFKQKVDFVKVENTDLIPSPLFKTTISAGCVLKTLANDFANAPTHVQPGGGIPRIREHQCMTFINRNVPGNDIKSVKLTNVFDCEVECMGSAVCKCFVWNSKTEMCYLKNVCKQLESHVIEPSRYCTVFGYTRVAGAAASRSYSSDANSCKHKCFHDGTCTGFSFDVNYRQCTTFTGGVTIIPEHGFSRGFYHGGTCDYTSDALTSGFCSSGPKCAVYAASDIGGAVVGQTRVSVDSECEAICSVNGRCDCYSFATNTPSGNNCVLKRGCGFPMPVRNSTAGTCKIPLEAPCHTRNLAWGRPTGQSWGTDSNLPVSHPPNSDWNAPVRTCSHTNSAARSFWYVDMGKQFVINTVTLTNRDDCCSDRLTNFDIFVADHAPTAGFVVSAHGRRCVHVPGSFSGTKTFFCDNPTLYGRYLGVQLRGTNILTLCGVAVTGCDVNPVCSETNLAWKKPAGQDGGIDAALPVTYTPNPNWWATPRTCSHTGSGPNKFWYVDLGKRYLINTVTLTNRDEAVDRLSDFDIFVVDTEPRTGFMVKAAERCVYMPWVVNTKRKFQCVDPTLSGRYVGVQLRGTNILTVCGAAVTGCDADRANLAWEKPTGQSGTGGGGPDRPVSYRPSEFWGDGTCSHTPSGANMYWYVDLERTYRIDTVKLTNRGDCCPDRLSNFDIFVSDRRPTTGFMVTDAQRCLYVPGTVAGTQTYRCSDNTLSGRYVGVQMRGTNYLTICGVYVTGDDMGLAWHKPTGQSSRDTSYRPVSNVPNAIMYSATHTCSHTESNPKEWWYVDMQNTYVIDTVTLTNRADCCADRLTNFDIFVADTKPTSGFVVSAAQRCFHEPGSFTGTKTYRCSDPNLSGRYLGVQLRGTNILTLCGVAVTGHDVNLAWQKPAGQSGGNDASLPVSYPPNGNWNAVPRTCCHTGSGPNMWWYVNLGKKYQIYTVTLTNRADCCPYRLSDFYIFATDTEPTSGFLATTAERCLYVPGVVVGTQTYRCSSPTSSGQFVGVQLRGTNHLTLCGMAVTGCDPSTNNYC